VGIDGSVIGVVVDAHMGPDRRAGKLLIEVVDADPGIGHYLAAQLLIVFAL